MSGRPDFLTAMVFGVVWSALAAFPTPALSAPVPDPRAAKIQAVDADNRKVLLNKPGLITVVVGTNEDSQDAARAAGKAMYPFQGRPDFALIVVVDLRHSIASWVPSIVTQRMRVSLDQEGYELKPYFLKNGNHNNPRATQHVIPDFTGTICPQLNWKEGASDLRVIIYGVDGREIERLDKVGIENMAALQADVRKAIQAQVDIEQARVAAIPKQQKPPPESRLPRIVLQHPPIVPYTPFAPKKDD